MPLWKTTADVFHFKPPQSLKCFSKLNQYCKTAVGREHDVLLNLFTEEWVNGLAYYESSNQCDKCFLSVMDKMVFSHLQCWLSTQTSPATMAKKLSNRLRLKVHQLQEITKIYLRNKFRIAQLSVRTILLSLAQRSSLHYAI